MASITSSKNEISFRILTSLVSRMHSLRSNSNGAAEEHRQKKKEKRASRQLHRTESEATGHKRSLLMANGLSPTDSLRLSDSQWMQMRPLVMITSQNGQQHVTSRDGEKPSWAGSTGSSSGGRRSPLSKAASLGVEAL